jgi:hypothetical protein
MYSKAAEDEDKKMVERWHKDADGILIFVSPQTDRHPCYFVQTGTLQTGLFSAAVAALLATTVQDLRQDPQDTSSFYLGNIYEVLADQNVTRASIPPPSR